MKTINVCILMSLVLFFSCKKEDISPIPEPPTPVPIFMSYTISSQYAALQNNTDLTTILVGYFDTYGIKFTYQYTADTSIKTAFAVVFPQFDQGSICLRNENTTTRTMEDVIKYRIAFDYYEFYFKFGRGDDTFIITPSSIPVGDTTSVLTLTNTVTQRQVRLPLQEILEQKFCLVYYDY